VSRVFLLRDMHIRTVYTHTHTRIYIYIEIRTFAHFVSSICKKQINSHKEIDYECSTKDKIVDAAINSDDMIYDSYIKIPFI